MSSPAGPEASRSTTFILTGLFVLAIVGSVPIALLGVVAWGLLGFGLEAVMQFCAAALMIGLGVEGARRTFRGERPWTFIQGIVLVVLVSVYAARR